MIDSFHSVQSMILEGAALATFIVFLFLNSWRSTVITGLTLPISIIGTMTAIYFLGFTLNMMSLMALSLAVGILIDDAIVVRENIMRHLHMGKSHRQAALDGTNEIGLAVLATTFSIVAVFLPVAFMAGILGRFFLQFGITVSVAVLISLFVSFTLDPMLSSVWYDPSVDPKAKRGLIGRAVAKFDDFFVALGEAYSRLLKRALRFRKTTLADRLPPPSPAVWRCFRWSAPSSCRPSDTGEFQVDMKLPVGVSLDRTAAKIAQVDALLRAEFDEVQRHLCHGQFRHHLAATTTPPSSPSSRPREERDRTPIDLTGPARVALQAIPGARFTVGAASGMGNVADADPAQHLRRRPRRARTARRRARRRRSGRSTGWSTSPPRSTIRSPRSASASTARPPPISGCRCSSSAIR